MGLRYLSRVFNCLNNSCRYTFLKFLQHARVLFLRNPKMTLLREKCMYSEFFWSVFSRIRTEYQSECGKILTRKTPNTDTSRSMLFPILIDSSFVKIDVNLNPFQPSVICRNQSMNLLCKSMDWFLRNSNTGLSWGNEI